MSHASSGSENIVDTLASLISCHICQNIASEESLFSCGHITCKSCDDSTYCSLCSFGEKGKVSFTSFRFAKDLYEQFQVVTSAKITDNRFGVQSILRDSVCWRRERHSPIGKNLNYINREDEVSCDVKDDLNTNGFKGFTELCFSSSSCNFVSNKNLSAERNKAVQCYPVELIVKKEINTEFRNSSVNKCDIDVEKTDSSNNTCSKTRVTSDKVMDKSTIQGYRLQTDYLNGTKNEAPVSNSPEKVCSKTPAVTLGFADVLELVERYKKPEEDTVNMESHPMKLIDCNGNVSNDNNMPKLEREDLSYLSSSELTEQDQDEQNFNPPKLEPFTLNESNDMETNENEHIESVNIYEDDPREERKCDIVTENGIDKIRNMLGVQEHCEIHKESGGNSTVSGVLNGEDSSVHNSSNSSIEEITGNGKRRESKHKQKDTSNKSTRKKHKRLRGFEDKDIFARAMKVLEFNTHSIGSSSITFCFQGKKVTIKNCEDCSTNTIRTIPLAEDKCSPVCYTPLPINNTMTRNTNSEGIMKMLLSGAEINNTDTAVNLTLTTCCLASAEIFLVSKFAKMFKLSLSEDFSHQTTHFVIGEGAIKSQNYLLAIAYRAYIVTMDWIRMCLQAESILHPDRFIPTIEEGPKRCLEPVLTPFNGFHIFLRMSSFPDYSLFVHMKTLCSLGGAKVILDFKEALYFINTESMFPRFFITGGTSYTTPVDLETCNKVKALPVSMEWVIASIKAYKAQSITKFLQIEKTLNQLSEEYYIPNHLLSDYCYSTKKK